MSNTKESIAGRLVRQLSRIVVDLAAIHRYAQENLEQPDLVQQHGSPRIYWSNVLERAVVEGCLPNLVLEVLRDYPGATRLAQELQAWNTAATAPPVSADVERTVRRSRAVFAAIAIGALALSSGGAWWLKRKPQQLSTAVELPSITAQRLAPLQLPGEASSSLATVPAQLPSPVNSGVAAQETLPISGGLLVPATSSPGNPDALISVDFSAQTRGSGVAEMAIFPGVKLHTGDRFWFTARLSREAHVYALQAAANGSAQLLFPLDSDSDVAHAAGTQIRVPPAPDMFELDEHTGTETLIVVTSLKPLASVDEALNELVQSARATPQTSASRPLAATQERQDPEPQARNINSYRSRIANRGIVRVQPNASIEAIEGNDGIALIKFEFLHEP